MALPSAPTLRIATEAVGEIAALSAMARPRPRLIVPLPRSNGAFQRSRSATWSRIASSGASLRMVPVACGRPSRSMFLRRNSTGSILQRARHHVGVALVGPGELRDAEAAQRAGRRHVGVERVGVDPDIVDVVGAGGGEAGFMGDARADIGIGAAVPEHLAFARGDAAVLVDAAFDAQRARMLGDLVELLLHRQRDLDRTAHDHRARSHQRFELDVELASRSRRRDTAP